MGKVKVSSQTGSLVLYLIWRGRWNKCQDVGSCDKESKVLSSHLAVFRLVSHTELDKRTWVAGHLLTRLKEKRSVLKSGNSLG